MKLLRVDDVSEMYDIPQATLRFWRHQGSGPPSAKLGRRIVYRQEDVEDWINAQFTSQK